MPRALLYAIVFIEGFCSLEAEVIALRRLVPHVGSSIVVAAPTIAFFLLALALGYAAGLGLAVVTVDGLFAHLQSVLMTYRVFIGFVVCPLAWLLGETVRKLAYSNRQILVLGAGGFTLSHREPKNHYTYVDLVRSR